MISVVQDFVEVDVVQRIIHGWAFLQITAMVAL